MLSSHFLIVSLVFAFTGLCNAKSLKNPGDARLGPERPGSRGLGSGLGSHRHVGSRPHRAVVPLPWRFPEEPVPGAPVYPPIFQLRPRTEHLALRCGEDAVDVEVSQDLLGTGWLVQPEELTLGGCSAARADDSSEVLLFHSKLHGCNSKLTMTNDALIYAFTLLYQPRSPRGGSIVRTAEAEVGLECRYSRLLLAGFK